MIVKRTEQTSDKQKRFTLRMDSELFETISLIAKQNRRSVAKEIEMAIADYVNEYLENHLDNPEE